MNPQPTPPPVGGMPELDSVRALAIAVEPVGSRVTCSPAPMNTDADYLVLVDDGGWNALLPVLSSESWVIAGSRPADECNINGEQTFASFKREHLNLIVTASKEFFDRFMAATYVAKRLNLLAKDDRIALFQAVLYANTWAPVPEPEPDEFDAALAALEAP
jgi:hypothetical protein